MEAGDYLSDHQGKTPDSSWPASVQALLKYPTVLSKLDDDLSWTTRLGLAQKNQSTEVTAAIQKSRTKARHAGNLDSNSKQKVVVVKNEIEIVPTDPTIVYVPTYNPSQIYAPHPYAPLLAFGAGIAVGVLLADHDNWYYNWYHHHYYDHLYAAGGHVAYVGPHGVGSVTHIGGPYGGYTHSNHIGPWGATRTTHVGGPYAGATHVEHVGPYGRTHVTHIGGPSSGITHVGHTGFYGHSSFNVGHIGRHAGGFGRFRR